MMMMMTKKNHTTAHAYLPNDPDKNVIFPLHIIYSAYSLVTIQHILPDYQCLEY